MSPALLGQWVLSFVAQDIVVDAQLQVQRGVGGLVLLCIGSLPV
jgi:hypothetical protein